MLPEAQVKVIVKEAVRETFLNMGLNVSDPDDIVKYQKDMHYLRTVRIRKEALETRAWLHFIGMLMSAIGAAVVLTLFQYRGN